MRLSALAIRNAKPRETPYKLGDGGGLYLLIKPNSTRLWRLNYAYMGRQKTLSFGEWPLISLAEAREKREEAKRYLAAGLDPSEERKLEQMRAELAASNTFRAIAEEWYLKNEREGLSSLTLAKIRWLLDKAYATLANRPITEIGAQEVLMVLRRIEAAKHYESAKRMRSVISRVFRYAIATARADRDVAVDLRGALVTPKVKHHAAITDPAEAGALLRAIAGYNGHTITKIALEMSAHVFVRPGELRQAEWSEFDFDRALWVLPSEKMKMRRPHRVPLSRQVLSLLDQLKPLTGHGRYVFPSFHSPRRPMSENTVNTALRRLGYAHDEMTAHGFRAMAATLLNEMSIWNADAIERQLAHMENNGVRRAYTRGEYWEERVRMMQHWSDYLDQLRDGAKVIRAKFGAA
ncbi:tyrosine-type recombinase/integrase [Sphingosinicella microcystinivorans]|uniref:Integrase n=1 Tax=Sphingosinicella microcystinivorans TaxID=335406 RepID=A0AAD1D8N3_SPHMI|nr:integrase arm-type DNA-binding domain-containing protein [Sphingosinicella microcystinivorans]RKS86587.1 integrase [Sphingosinicella microcystinivorans]BBE35304.1 integrase [Sphingosinicella microcystinivorans]